MHLRRFWNIARQSVEAWMEDDASSMGAAIAYYTIFSVAPLLVIVIALAGLVWGREAVQGEIVEQIAGLVGQEPAQTIQSLLQSAATFGSSLLATILGIGALLVGATSAFAELQRALDKVWRLPSAVRQKGILQTLRTRLLSFGLILGLTFLMIVSLVASAAIAAVGRFTHALFPGAELMMQLLNFLLSFGVTTLLFASIYKLMPQARIAWRDVWIGSAVTAGLFELGKMLIGLYLGKTGVTSSFGAAGSLAVLLIWVYYSAQVFLLGAEFTWVFANEHGSRSVEAQSKAAIPARAGMAAENAPLPRG